MLGAILFLSLVSPTDIEVDNRDLGLKLRLPDGFVDFPEGRQQPGVSHAYAHGDPQSDSYTIVLVSGLAGALPRVIPLPESLNSNGMFTFETSWKREFSLPVVCTRQQLGEIAVTAMVVQIPISPRALKIEVQGDASREDEMSKLMASIVDSVDGPTNWLTSRERKDRFVQATIQLLGVVAVIVALSVWYLRSRSKRRSPDNQSNA